MFIPASNFKKKPEPDELTSFLHRFYFRRDIAVSIALIPYLFDLGGGNRYGQSVTAAKMTS